MINCSWQDMSEFPPRYGWVPSLDPVGCAEIDPALRVTMNDLHSYWKWPFIVSFPIRNDVLTSPMEQLYINPFSKPSFFKESWSNHGVSARVFCTCSKLSTCWCLPWHFRGQVSIDLLFARLVRRNWDPVGLSAVGMIFMCNYIQFISQG